MSDVYKIVNPEFDFEFNGKIYHIRKANLEMGVNYQQKVKELADAKDSATESKLAAYAIYLVLRRAEPELTEQSVLENTPADIDVLEILTTLGFMSPQRANMVKAVQESVTKKLTTPNSTQ